MRMTQQSPAREPLLELYDAVAQRQLRDAGAEVAAAIAHAVLRTALLRANAN